MPSHLATVDQLLRYTKVSANALQDIADSSNIPFLSSVAGVTLLIVEKFQVRKFSLFQPELTSADNGQREHSKKCVHVGTDSPNNMSLNHRLLRRQILPPTANPRYYWCLR
jgi:hypothetical protein